jgi:hypothetical protein
MYITLARWCNQPSFFKKKSFKEFCKAHGEKSSCCRYMKEYEQYNQITADVFYNMKWVDVKVKKSKKTA